MSGVFTEGNILCEDARSQVDELENAFNDLIGKFHPIFDTFNSIAAGISNIETGLQSGRASATALKPLVDALPVTGPAKLLQEVSVAALGIAAKLFATIAKTVKAVSRRLRPLLDAIADIETIMNKPFDLFDPVYQTITKIQRVCLALIPNEPKIMADPAYTDEVSALRRVWNKIGRIIKTVLGRLVRFVRSIIRDLEEIANKLTEAVDKLKEVLPGFDQLKSILDGLNERVQAITDLVGPALEAVGDAVDAAKQAASDLLDWFETLPGVGDLVKETREAANSAIEALDKLKKAFEEKVSKAISDMEAFDVINIPIEALRSLLDRVVQVVNEKVTDAVNQALELLKNIQDEFKSSLDILSKFAPNKAIVERLIRQAMDALRQAAEGLLDVSPATKIGKLKEAAKSAEAVSNLLSERSHPLNSAAQWRQPLAVKSVRIANSFSGNMAEVTDQEWQRWAQTQMKRIERLSSDIDNQLPLQGPPDFDQAYFDQLAALISDAGTSLFESNEIFDEVSPAQGIPWFPYELDAINAVYEPLPKIQSGHDDILENISAFQNAYSDLNAALNKAETRFNILKETRA